MSAPAIPHHLARYIVEQDYAKYTPVDHAVWRYCLRQLKKFLSVHGHPCYAEGLEKTGISIEFIPKISDISACLEKFGWIARPVSGFIPPAAFMELQSLGVLPIASDMRTLDHLLYTPAPDIVHEAAGHAPIIIDPEYADYLKQYSQVAKMAIISKEDIDLYEAIRDLSDIKENPTSQPRDIARAEEKLNAVVKTASHVSEAAQLSRMNWWTAEYGLIGTLENPKIFGAGLLSSLGESRQCLKPEVKKLPLTLDCVHQSYDITEPQPQLYVTPNFKALVEILDQFSETMAYKNGGAASLEKLKEAGSVNTVELDSGLQVSGVLENYLTDIDGRVIFFKMQGPSQISLAGTEIDNHGKRRHPHGYSAPIGAFTADQLILGQVTVLTFESGFRITGHLKNKLTVPASAGGALAGRTSAGGYIYTFAEATVSYEGQIFFQPDWGDFDLVTGHTVKSAYGGPADRIRYGTADDFVATKVPPVHHDQFQLTKFKFYQAVRDFRHRMDPSPEEFASLFLTLQKNTPQEWLLFVELVEIARKNDFDGGAIEKHLASLGENHPALRTMIQDGLELAHE